ncbi:hypothetical protein [Acetatifactor aquisgranensis]|nr:hypothetical protein [Acetatifactor aquisgranensis]
MIKLNEVEAVLKKAGITCPFIFKLILKEDILWKSQDWNNKGEVKH